MFVTYQGRSVRFALIFAEKWNNQGRNDRREAIFSRLTSGGLEIPCTIIFEGVEKDVEKVKSAALTPPTGDENLPPDNKRRKIDS